MEPWLNRSDLETYIGSDQIPPSFKEQKLSATLLEVIEGWLSDILLPDDVATYSTLFSNLDVIALYTDALPYPQVPLSYITSAQYSIGKTIKQFLAYAVWSIYVKKSNAINTDTGIVAKLNPDSERISDRQRTELSVYYQGLAERKALEIQRALIRSDTCSPAYAGNGRPVVRKAQRPSPSRLGN